MNKNIWLMVGVLACGAGAPAVLYGADENVGLAEVVVTAQKRAEDLDKVPISITTFDQSEMDKRGIRSLADVLNVSPGVDFHQEGVRTQLSIRGISSGTGSATTGIYLDDVPLQIRTPTLNLVGFGAPKVFDLDHVEVLRGPQGTYFGAGAEGGAIRFITPQASLTSSSGYARAGLAAIENGGIGYEAGAAFGGPIVADTLGFRVSAWHEHQAGYVDHYSTLAGGMREGSSNWSDTDAVKMSMLYQPAAAVKISPSLFFQDQYTHDNSSFNIPPSNLDGGALVNSGLLKTPSVDRIVLPSVRAEVDFGALSLTSISSYLYRDNSYILDYTNFMPSLLGLGLPSPTSATDFTSVPYDNTQKNVTQELRLQSSNPAARLKWMLGGFFSLAHQQVYEATYQPNLSNFLLENIGKTVEQAFGSSLLPGNFSSVDHNSVHDRQLAAFAQVDYEVIDGLVLTAGARIARQSNDFTLLVVGPIAGGTNYSQGNQKETVTTPKYGVSYQITPETLVYASAAKGNRMGGGNSSFPVNPPCLEQLKEIGVSSSPGQYISDSVWSYEVGSKQKLFDNRVRLEASAFHLDWSNKQQSIYVPACAFSFVANVGKATSNGFDLALNAQASEHLLVGISVGYVNARNAQTTGIPGGGDYTIKGAQVDSSQAPWTVSGTLEYDFNVFEGQNSYVRLDDQFRSKNPGPYTFMDPRAVGYNPSAIVNASTNQLNARLGTQINGFDLSVYGTNLANAHPLINATSALVAPLGNYYTLQPRTVGITSTYRW